MEADDVYLDSASYSTDNQGGFLAKTFINYLKGAAVYSHGRAACFKGGYYETYGEGKMITPVIFYNNGGKVFVSVDLIGWAGFPNRTLYDLFMFEF